MDREAACPCPLQPAQLAEGLSPHRSVAAASAAVRVGTVQSGSEPSERLEVVGGHGTRDPSLICTIPTVVAVNGGRGPPSSPRVHTTSGGTRPHPRFDVFPRPRFDVAFEARVTRSCGHPWHFLPRLISPVWVIGCGQAQNTERPDHIGSSRGQEWSRHHVSWDGYAGRLGQHHSGRLCNTL